jgi:hypothetical protein
MHIGKVCLKFKVAVVVVVVGDFICVVAYMSILIRHLLSFGEAYRERGPLNQRGRDTPPLAEVYGSTHTLQKCASRAGLTKRIVRAHKTYYLSICHEVKQVWEMDMTKFCVCIYSLWNF